MCPIGLLQHQRNGGDVTMRYEQAGSVADRLAILVGRLRPGLR
jgi:hypothetical protein